MFKKHCLLFSLAAVLAAGATQSAAAASAGRVEFATPGVNAIDAGGQSRALARGAEISPGDIIDTGGGRAQLRFSDGGMVSLQPQTRFRLDSYGYDSADTSKNSVVMNLLRGGLRSITGLIGKTNRQGYKLLTATATVGIRGTEFSVKQAADGSVLFNCADGTIAITNQAGAAEISGGQSARVTSANSAPQKTDDKPFLPPGAANTGIAPPNNPVQDAAPAVPLLTGTFSGEWRVGASAQSFGPSTSPPPVFIVAGDGTLQSFSDGGTFTTLGAAHAISDGNDGVMAWGRWIGGPAPGVGYNTSGNVFPQNDPLHYVVGLPASGVPTAGTGSFTSYASTPATCSGGPCGSINTTSTIAINFGNNTGSYSLSSTNSADGLSIRSSGSLSVSNGINFAGTSSSVSGGYGGSTTGSSNLDGFLAGPGASHAGAIYNLSYISGPSLTTVISGALVYRR